MPERAAPGPLAAGAAARPAVVELVYFNAGGGHRASALALQAAIARAGLPWTVRLTHLFEVLDPTARCGAGQPRPHRRNRPRHCWDQNPRPYSRTRPDGPGST